eukprot:m.69143 g.69143  ORF g.69143 m.69143 type:complete len:539 (-) comp12216_c1_seq2:184-1800(-)
MIQHRIERSRPLGMQPSWGSVARYLVILGFVAMLAVPTFVILSAHHFERDSDDDDDGEAWEFEPTRGQITLGQLGCLNSRDGKLEINVCAQGVPSQMWLYTPQHQLKNMGTLTCVDITGVHLNRPAKMAPCASSDNGAEPLSNALLNQQFDLVSATDKKLWTPRIKVVSRRRDEKHLDTRFCLAPLGQTAIQAVVLQRCAKDCSSPTQIWMSLAENMDGTLATPFDTPTGVNNDDDDDDVEPNLTPRVEMIRYQAGAGPNLLYDITEKLKNDQIKSTGRILCWIMTHPDNHDTKARAVMNTWGKHCDRLVYVSAAPIHIYPTDLVQNAETWIVDLPMNEDRDALWLKSKQTWLHAYEHHLLDYDWFVRGDDDTFILMDNLRDFLKDYSPNDPQYFGRLFNGIDGDDDKQRIKFYSGGSGTVLSRQALYLLGKSARDLPDTVSFADDMELGYALRSLGVEATENVDKDGKQLFLCLGLDYERGLRRADDPTFWFWDYSPEAKEGPDCCADKWIGTHYASPIEMRDLEDRHSIRCEGVEA